MYIQGLIPQNTTELAEAVLIGTKTYLYAHAVVANESKNLITGLSLPLRTYCMYTRGGSSGETRGRIERVWTTPPPLKIHNNIGF